jgi:hypothetical protein
MALSLLDTFRVLASFSPERTSLRGAPWDAYADWAVAQGLAPLAAYNLEYRLGGAGAPEWVRDRLLSVYQGSLNDNVMKLVNFKRAIGALEGRRIIVVGAASFAEALYPHLAFRPVPDLDLLVARVDLGPLAAFLAESEFKPVSATARTRVVSDGRTQITLHDGFLGPGFETEEKAVLERATPMRALGPSMYRLAAEDAVLSAVLGQAQVGYSVPYIEFVDLRELLLGAPSTQGAYSHPLNVELIRNLTAAWRVERALYASTRIVSGLFPDAEVIAERLTPKLRPATRALLDSLVVAPLASLGRMREIRGAERLRRLLSGGRSASTS